MAKFEGGAKMVMLSCQAEPVYQCHLPIFGRFYSADNLLESWLGSCNDNTKNFFNLTNGNQR